MTALDLVTELRLHLGGETTETLSDSQLLRWLNRAYLELASNYNFSELDTSVTLTVNAGDSEPEINTATNILEILSITDTTNKQLLYPWSRWQYDKSVQGNAANITGVASYWFKSGVDTATGYTQLTLYPTPAASTIMTVVYRKVPAELVLTPLADVTSSVLLPQWDDTMLLMAVSKGWRALGDDDKGYKAQLGANNSAKIAEKSTFVASYVPFTPSSIMGRALS